jgi:hypothetical protein
MHLCDRGGDLIRGQLHELARQAPLHLVDQCLLVDIATPGLVKSGNGSLLGRRASLTVPSRPVNTSDSEGPHRHCCVSLRRALTSGAERARFVLPAGPFRRQAVPPSPTPIRVYTPEDT